MEQARNWRGESYEAIALMGAWEDVNLGSVAIGIGMRNESNLVATMDEVQKATVLLCTCLKAIHYAVTKAEAGEWPGVSTEWLRRETFDTVAISNGFDFSSRVRKVKFQSHIGDDEVGCHVAPDPILLAAN